MLNNTFCFLLFSCAFVLPAFSEIPELHRYTLASEDPRLDEIAGSSPGLGSGLSIYPGNSKRFLSVADEGAYLKNARLPFAAILSLKDELIHIEKLIAMAGLDDFLDPEGIDFSNFSKAWIVEESKPSLLELDLEKNKILRSYHPGDGLPSILKHVQINRGFEGVAITPSGKLLLAVQGPLDIDGETAKKAQITRLLLFDPLTEKSKMFAYLPERELYDSIMDVRISALAALSETTFFLVERGALANGSYTNRVYLVDTSRASALSENPAQAEERVRTVKDLLLKREVLPVQKELFLNLRHFGWKFEKSEGIAISEDRKSLFISNDPDEDKDEELEIWEFRFDNPIHAPTGRTYPW